MKLMNPRQVHSLAQVRMIKDAAGFEVETLNHYLIDGVYIKPFVAKKTGTFMGQHSHTYDHATFVSSGSIRVFIDGEAMGDYEAGEVITIRAGKKHVLLALEDNTVAACIHNTHGELEPHVAEEAEFPKGVS
jgi:mannose-6-phosphate isomerase-like protein (cupin superfamily)